LNTFAKTEMLEFLENIDQKLFLLINGWHNPAVDSFMFYITDTEFWFPFYGLLLIFLVWKLKWKAIPVVAFVLITVGLSDLITSQFMKPFFQRLRPCHEPELMNLVHIVDGCGKKYGFASGHASNSFALATFLWVSLRHTFKPVFWIFAWSMLVSYSRIYVGEHYPGDVIAGALVGSISAIILYYLFMKINPYLPGKIKLHSHS
jgi:undecaprenyl-diphosphatase